MVKKSGNIPSTPDRSTTNENSSQGTPVPAFGNNRGIDGADFDRSVLYEDRFAPEEIDLTADVNVGIDPDLRKFLFDHARVDHIYLDSMLAWNGIRSYEDCKECFVDTHNFTDLEHIYLKLGPNALGQKVASTERLQLLGHYIATQKIKGEDGTLHPIVVFDPSMKIFRPSSFD